jgi:hypothetical protein
MPAARNFNFDPRLSPRRGSVNHRIARVLRRDRASHLKLLSFALFLDGVSRRLSSCRLPSPGPTSAPRVQATLLPIAGYRLRIEIRAAGLYMSCS